MRVARTLSVLWLCALAAVSARGQGFVEGMDDVLEKIDAKDWGGALTGLLSLCEKAGTDQERYQVAAKLYSVGGAIRNLGRPDVALRAYRASVAIQEAMYGREANWDLAKTRGCAATCLQALGRFEEASEENRAALAMYEGARGSVDSEDVAATLSNLAVCLQKSGKPAEAVPLFDAALAMQRRLAPEKDGDDVAVIQNNFAFCLRDLGREQDALSQFEASLAEYRRLSGGRDTGDQALAMREVASSLQTLGRLRDGLATFEAALGMAQRLSGGRDDATVAASLASLGLCLVKVGRPEEALAKCEAAHEMCRRLNSGRDHEHLASSLNEIAVCLDALGRHDEARQRLEEALAMHQRLAPRVDNHRIAAALNNLAACFRAQGRVCDALPRFEEALAMWRRLARERDDQSVATATNNVACCLEELGRSSEALPRFRESLEMTQRLHGGQDHLDTALGLNSVAGCLEGMGRISDALPIFEASLAMKRRLLADSDHPDTVTGINNVAHCLRRLGRVTEAVAEHEAALAMSHRLFPDRDHWLVGLALGNVAGSLAMAGRLDEASARFEEALAMCRRIVGGGDHPNLVMVLRGLAGCREDLGKGDEAIELYGQSAAMIERVRDEARASPQLRQSLFDRLKSSGVFERLQLLATRRGAVDAALHAAERSRGRELLDMLEQRFDPLDEVMRNATMRSDIDGAQRAGTLRGELAAVSLEIDRLMHVLASTDLEHADETERTVRRQEVGARLEAAARQRRGLLDERARLIAEDMPVGRVRSVDELQVALKTGELFVEYTLTEAGSVVYVVEPDGTSQAIELPVAFSVAERVVPELLRIGSRAPSDEVRGRDPDEPVAQFTDPALSHELFNALVPSALWEQCRRCKHVLVAPHRSLHRLSFEQLVVSRRNDSPRMWIDDGPAIAYVPSGSVLHWLRARPRTTRPADGISLLAIGDPELSIERLPVPEDGALVLRVQAEGPAARAGLLAGDVLRRYDDKDLTDDEDLGAARKATEAAIAAGTRADGPILIEVWRRGEMLRFEVPKGSLGLQIGKGRASCAYAASLDPAAQQQGVIRRGDLERLRRLARLAGARAEAIAIDDLFSANNHRTRRLLGSEASESAVFDLAGRAQYLHFACHGLAEEYAGQSLSMLVLAQPRSVQPSDDGMLKVDDLFSAWRGRLAACDLVVLSACRTNVGPTQRDDAPHALPLGFLFAGVPAVIASLWAVDDESTRILMTDFYSRLLAGENDKLAAFTAAKKALRANPRFADPFHWAPFLFIGIPDR